MASFKVQIEDMIGSVGDDQFLADSVNAVAKEIINAMPPKKLWTVSEESGEQSTNDSYSVEDSKVLAVFRESGTNNEFIECQEIPLQYKYKIQNTNSMFNTTNKMPAFLLINGKVDVYPAPTSGEEKFKVVSVKYPALTNTTVASAGEIAFFPDDLEGLLVLGSAVRGSQYLMARVKDNLAGLAPNFVAPTFPTISTLSTSDAPTSPALKPVSYANAAKEGYGTADVAALATAPTYIGAVPSVDTAQLETFLETNEDPELAGVQVERMRIEIAKYQADMTNNLNNFNESAESYRADLQKKIKQTDSDIAKSQIDANNGTNVALQNAAKQMESIFTENRSSLEKYQADIQKHTAIVNKEVQEFVNNEIQNKFQRWATEYTNLIQTYATDIQKYNSNIQRYSSEYQWYQDQYNRLDKKYNEMLKAYVAN